MQEKILWFLAGTAGTILLAIVAWSNLKPQTVEPLTSAAPLLAVTPEPLTTAIRVEILNGCGFPQVAARLTRRARDLGLDVIHEGNADRFDHLHTLVIHRGGDPEQARQVASVLNIPHLIEQQTQGAFRLADVVIIIGHDFRRINLFAEDR
jgi:hypothetical protein